MKTLAHISDLHFGREDPRLVKALISALHAASPDIVVVSGDFTQRAKKRQFRAARAFLQELPRVPRLVIPGNHDISATNLFERAVRPLQRYRRFIAQDLSPTLAIPGVALAGINTVRLLSTKNGRINRAQVALACHQLSQANAPVRIVVTHQPIDVPADDIRHPPITRARMAMAAFARCHVDLFLSGHLHSGLTLATNIHYPIHGYSAIVVHAGTAVSTRTRSQPNSWNLLRIAPTRIDIQQMAWTGKTFAPAHLERYNRLPNGWTLTPS